jgi:hypothetical protein
MTVARSVADVLDEHVLFEVESIDRMYLNVWQPRLAYGGGVQGFFVGHRGHRGHHGADGPDDQGVGRRHPRLRRRPRVGAGQPRQGPAQGRYRPGVPGQVHPGRGGAVRRPGPGEGRRVAHPAPPQPAIGGSYAWLVRSSAFINFFYFYCVDAEFGPFFISSAPTSDRSSQRPDEAGGSRIREAPVRAVSSPDNGGTRRDSRTAWVRLVRRKGVREEPVF